MKSIFLSISCSILLSNSCLTMDQQSLNLNNKLPNSISTEKLAGWDTLDEDIQPTQTVPNTEMSKKSIGWFPVINAVRNSFRKKAPQSIESSKKVEPMVHVLKPKNATAQTSTVVTKTRPDSPQPSAVITSQIPLDNIPSQKQQDIALTTVQTILSVKEQLHVSDNSHDGMLTDHSSIISRAPSTIISPLQRKNTSSSASTLISSQDHSIQAMSIDRDSNNSPTERHTEEQSSLFAMLQNGCCNCFDTNFNVFSDLENKKKSSK